MIIIYRIEILSNIAVLLVTCIILSIAQFGFHTDTIKWKTFLALTVVYLIYEGIKYLVMKDKPKEAVEEMQFQTAVTEVEDNRNPLLKWVIKINYISLRYSQLSLFLSDMDIPFVKKTFTTSFWHKYIS